MGKAPIDGSDERRWRIQRGWSAKYTLGLGHFWDAGRRRTAQMLDLFGVPYRIRTGVAAVRGPQVNASPCHGMSKKSLIDGAFMP